MRISILLLTLLLAACANTSVVIPVQGPIGIRIEGGEREDCEPVIVNGRPQGDCLNHANPVSNPD